MAGQARLTLPTRVQASNADTGVEAARLGLGLIQAPRHRLRRDLVTGSLVEVLTDCPPALMPISILHPGNRSLAPRTQAFIDWLVEVVGPQVQLM